MASSPTLLFVDLPPKTFVGIDLLSFNSSATFRGISEVPTGLHFVYTGTDASLSIRHGHWLNIATNTALQVLRWSPQTESLTLLPTESNNHHNEAAHLPSLRPQNLIAYPALEGATNNLQPSPTTTSTTSHQPTNADWPSLISHIQPSTINRITPTTTLTSISTALSDSESIPGLTHSEALSALPADSQLSFTEINLKQTWADGDIGSVRTERARDRSWYLNHIITILAGEDGDRQVGARRLLGEMQFCFMMVLTLANYSCLAQWKRIFGVVFTCREALGEVEGFFVEVLKVLALQLGHAEDVEGGLFELREESGSAWLRGLVGRFRESVEDVLGRGGILETELGVFEGMMRERFGWEGGKGVLRRGMVQLEDGEMVEVAMEGADEEEEKGDWAPVVVDET